MPDKNDRFAELASIAPGPTGYPPARLQVIYDFSYNDMIHLIYQMDEDSCILAEGDAIITDICATHPVINRYKMNGYYAAYQDAPVIHKTAISLLFREIAGAAPEVSYDPMVARDMQSMIAHAQTLPYHDDDHMDQMTHIVQTLNIYAAAGKIDPDILVGTYIFKEQFVDLMERTPKAIPSIREKFRESLYQISCSDLFYNLAVYNNDPSAADIARKAFHATETDQVLHSARINILDAMPEDDSVDDIIHPLITRTRRILGHTRSGRSKDPIRLTQYMTYLNIVLTKWPEYHSQITPIARQALLFAEQKDMTELADHALALSIEAAFAHYPQDTSLLTNSFGPE